MQAVVIHKMVVKITGEQSYEIDNLAEVLSFAVQGDELVMYFMRYGTDGVCKRVNISIRGTGHEFAFPEVVSKQFMGTHSMCDGSLMWHVWVGVSIAEGGEFDG